MIAGLEVIFGVGLDERPPQTRPRTLWEGIRHFFHTRRSEWDRMALEGWELRKRESHLLAPAGVLDAISRTDKREVHRDRIEHFVDSEGKYRVTVYH